MVSWKHFSVSTLGSEISLAGFFGYLVIQKNPNTAKNNPTFFLGGGKGETNLTVVWDTLPGLSWDWVLLLCLVA